MTKSIKEIPWSNSSTSSSSLITKSVIHQKIQEQQSIPTLGKCEITTKFQPNKLTKLLDIASNALQIDETSIKIPEGISEQEEPESIITLILKKGKTQ